MACKTERKSVGSRGCHVFYLVGCWGSKDFESSWKCADVPQLSGGWPCGENSTWRRQCLNSLYAVWPAFLLGCKWNLEGFESGVLIANLSVPSCATKYELMLLQILGIQSRVEAFQYWEREACATRDLWETQLNVENGAAFAQWEAGAWE